jgi:tRNA-2-methylthio-N6-dimethylallyladenosine synthase
MSTLFAPHKLAFTERPRVQKATYFVQTWGCQMNEEDSEQMALYLEQVGLTRADSIVEAQVILLNTCSVRKKPEDKAFSLLGELAFVKKARPDTVIGVCGCMAQLRAKEIRQRAPHVDFVVGTGNLSEIPALVEEAFQEQKFQTRLELPARSGAIVSDLPIRRVGREAKLKAYVPIQYGCDKFCTFCIVPTTRGRERSRSTEDILDEVKRLADNGTKEITLLGQTVNSYGKNMLEGKVPFSELLAKVAEVSGIERIRFTSPYPRDFKTDVIQAIRDIPQVMEHLHMPLQAGSNSELKRMKRLYTIESFKDIVQEVRESIPNVGLTTDLIVGFPGETEEEYQGTLQAVRDIRFDNAYMFAYSPRPGTPAADWEDQIPADIKKARINELIALQSSISQEINSEQVGKEFEILIDSPVGKDAAKVQGLSRCFRQIQVEGSTDRIGRIAKVKATKAMRSALIAELV